MRCFRRDSVYLYMYHRLGIEDESVRVGQVVITLTFGFETERHETDCRNWSSRLLTVLSVVRCRLLSRRYHVSES